MIRVKLHTHAYACTVGTDSAAEGKVIRKKREGGEKNIPEHFCPLVELWSGIFLYCAKKAARELQ